MMGWVHQIDWNTIVWPVLMAVAAVAAFRAGYIRGVLAAHLAQTLWVFEAVANDRLTAEEGARILSPTVLDVQTVERRHAR